ncbi:GFA family protein [Bradyrhizobium sp. AZCC 2262]|uniref:GFA family protein n=1 Tax=Bradyrhizobium sp. AZCC 2262 TaxID=3117022 RepID=UPI003FA586FD
MTGGCQCGAIRHEITSFPLLLYTCNCTDCQRQTGSAFARAAVGTEGDGCAVFRGSAERLGKPAARMACPPDDPPD